MSSLGPTVPDQPTQDETRDLESSEIELQQTLQGNPRLGNVVQQILSSEDFGEININADDLNYVLGEFTEESPDFLGFVLTELNKDSNAIPEYKEVGRIKQLGSDLDRKYALRKGLGLIRRMKTVVDGESVASSEIKALKNNFKEHWVNISPETPRMQRLLQSLVNSMEGDLSNVQLPESISIVVNNNTVDLNPREMLQELLQDAFESKYGLLKGDAKEVFKRHPDHPLNYQSINKLETALEYINALQSDEKSFKNLRARRKASMQGFDPSWIIENLKPSERQSELDDDDILEEMEVGYTDVATAIERDVSVEIIRKPKVYSESRSMELAKEVEGREGEDRVQSANGVNLVLDGVSGSSQTIGGLLPNLKHAYLDAAREVISAEIVKEFSSSELGVYRRKNYVNEEDPAAALSQAREDLRRVMLNAQVQIYNKVSENQSVSKEFEQFQRALESGDEELIPPSAAFAMTVEVYINGELHLLIPNAGDVGAYSVSSEGLNHLTINNTGRDNAEQRILKGWFNEDKEAYLLLQKALRTEDNEAMLEEVARMTGGEISSLKNLIYSLKSGHEGFGRGVNKTIFLYDRSVDIGIDVHKVRPGESVIVASDGVEMETEDMEQFFVYEKTDEDNKEYGIFLLNQFVEQVLLNIKGERRRGKPIAENLGASKFGGPGRFVNRLISETFGSIGRKLPSFRPRVRTKGLEAGIGGQSDDIGVIVTNYRESGEFVQREGRMVNAAKRKDGALQKVIRKLSEIYDIDQAEFSEAYRSSNTDLTTSAIHVEQELQSKLKQVLESRGQQEKVLDLIS